MHWAAVTENLSLLLIPNVGWRAEGRSDAPLARHHRSCSVLLFPQFIFGLHLSLLTSDFHLLYCKTRGTYLDLYSQQLHNFHIVKERFIDETSFLFS